MRERDKIGRCKKKKQMERKEWEGGKERKKYDKKEDEE